MNAPDILAYGQRDLEHAFAGLTEKHWKKVGVSTHWSLKDLLAHLVSYEVMLAEALGKAVDPTLGTPTLEDMQHDQPGFNDRQVAKRKTATPEQLFTELHHAHAQVMSAVTQLGPERLRQVGTIPWYGPQYSLDDLIVYTNYAHIREHSSQAKRWRQTL